MIIRKNVILCVLAGMASALAACSRFTSPAASITLATTTSTQDSGLLDVLLPIFEQQTGIGVKVIAVGSGQALALGRRGDADVLLVHSPEAEKQFMQEGFGLERRPVMANDFVVVGPEHDPAHIQGQSSAAAAFRRIAENQALFVSRGDESGTHAKEKAIWQLTAITPGGPWYLSAGGGMAQTLRVASERQAYTLADRGTFLAEKGHLQLRILYEGDPILLNSYSVIIVNADRHPHVKVDLARKLADFLTSPETQKMIGEFGVDRFGQPLFYPAGRYKVAP